MGDYWETLKSNEAHLKGSLEAAHRHIERRDGGLPSLPEADDQRGRFPMFDGLLAYFPNALAAVSEVSKIGSEKHNPGEPMHWARDKSTDHLNKIIRHSIDAGKKDASGVRHSAYLAWRALANLQDEIERDEGAPPSRGSRFEGSRPAPSDPISDDTYMAYLSRKVRKLTED